MQKKTNKHDIIKTRIQQYRDGNLQLLDDSVCCESPLEFRLPFLTASAAIEYRTLAITMRTPGDDIELATGFLYSEGVISAAADITVIRVLRQNRFEVDLTASKAYIWNDATGARLYEATLTDNADNVVTTATTGPINCTKWTAI